ncbi:MAG: hypothetical protein FJ143_18500 [Deltaproteobacteria bacterium]|nr:hypothetical protein [Deltaproteobacteria bacterium]MBM4299737.1 hypothetical protein [Deltaproteobacteria bacterium]
MDSTVDQAKLKVRQWAETHRQAVSYDVESAILLDVASGKRLQISWRDLSAFEEKMHAESREPYLVLLFAEGTQIALVDPGGIAFAPVVKNSGPVAGLPAVVCLRDFHTLRQRVDHYLYDHPDAAPPRECLDMIMICIAILDGARAVGFDVGDLEGELEKSLNEVEKRAS